WLRTRRSEVRILPGAPDQEKAPSFDGAFSYSEAQFEPPTIKIRFDPSAAGASSLTRSVSHPSGRARSGKGPVVRWGFFVFGGTIRTSGHCHCHLRPDPESGSCSGHEQGIAAVDQHARS